MSRIGQALPGAFIVAVYLAFICQGLAFAVNGTGYLLGFGEQRSVYVDSKVIIPVLIRSGGETSAEELPIAYGHYLDQAGVLRETTLFGGDLEPGMTVSAREAIVPLLPDLHRTSQAVAQLIFGLLCLVGLLGKPYALGRASSEPSS